MRARTLVVGVLASLMAVAPAAADPDVEPWSYDSLRVVGEDKQSGAASTPEITTSPEPNKPEYSNTCNVAWDDDLEAWRCGRYDKPENDPDNPDASLGDVQRAIREVRMPALKLHIQPGGRTLVNVDTIFYTDPTRLRRTVTLLGHSVRLDASPVSFTWVHGDGTTETTGKPGRPYPAKDVTHQYLQPGDDLRARVDTTYRVRYSVDGGGWATLDETLTAPGPTTALDVDEAAPVLTR